MTEPKIDFDDIVAMQRKARFGDTTPDQWGERVKALMAAQPDVSEPIMVRNVRPVETKAGGSNGTLFFEADFFEHGASRSARLVLRFLPAEGLFKDYDVSRQFGLQKSLAGTEVPVAPQLWLDPDGTFLKTPGYVMERVEGETAPFSWRTSGLIAEASPAERKAIMFEQIRMLAKIHAVDWRAAGLEPHVRSGLGKCPQEREINWYWDALLWGGQPEDVERLAPVREWLIAHEPLDVDVTLVHGDPNYGNYVFRDGRIVAVLDWEMAFLGAPELDLAARRSTDDAVPGPALDGAPTHDELWAEYERVSGRKLKNMPYFMLFVAYRSSVILSLTLRHYPDSVRPSFVPIVAGMRERLEARFAAVR